MDEQGHTSDVQFGQESAVVDKLVNCGVCGIAVVAVIVVGILVIRQNTAPSTQPPPAAHAAPTGAPNNAPASFTAATNEQTGPAHATNATDVKTLPPRTVRVDPKPKEVDVPVVIDVHEHRSSPKKSTEGDGR